MLAPRMVDVLVTGRAGSLSRVWENECVSENRDQSGFRRASFIHCTDSERVYFSALPFRFYENIFVRSDFCPGSGRTKLFRPVFSID